MASRKVRLKGEHLIHRTLWQTAERFLEMGLSEPRGRFYPLLAAVVFAYFAFEAYLNTALRGVATDVWKEERTFFNSGAYRGTLGKFKYLAELAGVDVERSRRPYQTVRVLAEARDFLAHAKVEEFDLVVSADKLDDAEPRSSVLRVYAEPKFAQKALEDVERLSDGLQRALFVRFGPLLFGSEVGAFSGISGGWGASLIHEPDKMPNQALQPTRRARGVAGSKRQSRAARG
jgi:hypothetical protein